MRAALESFSVRLACERDTGEELAWLRSIRPSGKAALKANDMEAYRIYNGDLHAAIMEAARNSYLSSAMGQLTLQSQMLMAKTIRLVGRPSRAIEEHRDLIELIAKRKDKPAKALMERHILSALDDILRYGISKRVDEAEGSNGIATKSGAGG